MKAALLALALLCQPASAAVIETWSGPGPNACRDRCTLEWAETQLTDDELAQLKAKQEEQPDPALFLVEDGTVFTLMSYFKDGKPIAYRTWTVAALTEFETAWGWDMGEWAFVRLDACGNWAIIKKGTTIPVLSVPKPIAPSVQVFLTPPVTPAPVDPCCVIVVPPVDPVDPVDPSPVPIPLPGLLLLGALSCFAVLKGKSK